MDEHDCLAEQFEANRPHLRAVAYRMLGSLSEADDAVQESWLRLSRSGTSGVKNLGGWLTTVVARVCLDMLRSRKSRHEESLDARIPDPIASFSRCSTQTWCCEAIVLPSPRAHRGRFAARRPWPGGRRWAAPGPHNQRS